MTWLVSPGIGVYTKTHIHSGIFRIRVLKKVSMVVLCLLLLGAGSAFLFRAQLWELVIDQVTKDTFISSDTDSFDPGLAIGSQFPAIRALYKGEEVSEIRDFALNRGMVFVANRSADW